MAKFIEPFEVTFNKVYDMYTRKELSFLGVNIGRYTLWLPVEFEKDKPRIQFYNNVDEIQFNNVDEDFSQLMTYISIWGTPVLQFLSEIVSFIRKEQGELNKYNAIDHSICKKCGGICCKNSGCYYSTRDFKEISFENLTMHLLKGYTAIVEIEKELSGYDNSLVLKVRNVNQSIVDIDTPTSSQCILLGESGCQLGDSERPYGGRALIPQAKHSCITGYTFREIVAEWRPYQGLLFQLAKCFMNKEIPFNGL